DECQLNLESWPQKQPGLDSTAIVVQRVIEDLAVIRLSHLRGELDRSRGATYLVPHYPSPRGDAGLRPESLDPVGVYDCQARIGSTGLQNRLAIARGPTQVRGTFPTFFV